VALKFVDYPGAGFLVDSPDHPGRCGCGQGKFIFPGPIFVEKVGEQQEQLYRIAGKPAVPPRGGPQLPKLRAFIHEQNF